MKKFLNFVKKKTGLSPNPSTPRSVLAPGYEIKKKHLNELHLAAYRGDVPLIGRLLRCYDINELDRENRTALHLACAKGQSYVVSVLAYEKCKLNLCDNEHRSPLLKALQSHKVKCANTLLDHGADPDIIDIVGNTALHYAVLIQSKATVFKLFERGARLDIRNSDGCTPFMLAVAKKDTEIVEFLINNGVNVDAEDHQGRTPLMIAASNGHVGYVKLLLENNVNIFKKDKKGCNADDHGMVNGHDDCSHLIIEYRKEMRSKSTVWDFNTMTNPSTYSSPHRVLGSSYALGFPAAEKKYVPQNSECETTPPNEVTTVSSCSSPEQEDDLFDWAIPSCSYKVIPCNQLPADLPQKPVSKTTPPKEVTTKPPATQCPVPEAESDLSDWDSPSSSYKVIPCNQLPADLPQNPVSETTPPKVITTVPPATQCPVPEAERDSSNNRILAGIELDIKCLRQQSEEKDLVRKNAALQAENNALKQDLHQVRISSQEKENRYIEEIKILGEKMDDLRRELQMKEETFTQTVIQYNGQLNALETEAAKLSSKLEHEKQSKERLETELESIRSRLNSTSQELDTNQTLKADAKLSLQRERDVRLRSQDKLNHKLSSMYEKNSSLSQQLSKIEAKSKGLDCELHETLLSLQEKTQLLENTQRGFAQGEARIKDLERMLEDQKKELSKSAVKQDSMQESLAQSLRENLLLRQQLEEAQNKRVFNEKPVRDVQDKSTDLYNKLHPDTDRQIQIYKERNRKLTKISCELLEKLYKVESAKVKVETTLSQVKHELTVTLNTLRQLKHELAVALKKLSVSEASLEDITRSRNGLEEDKQHLEEEVKKLRSKMESDKKKDKTSESSYLETKSKAARIKEKSLRELDRSITELLNQGYADVDSEATRFSTVADITRSMTDLKSHPVYIDTLKYLAARKKNYMT